MTATAPLSALLHAEVQAAEALCDVLEREYAALTRPRFDDAGFNGLLDEKRACLEQLQRHTEQRLQHLHQRGFNGGDVSAAIADHTVAERTALNALRDTLTQLGERVRRQNDANGALVNARRRFTEQALATLHGHNLSEQVYGQDARLCGSNAAAANSRPLASA